MTRKENETGAPGTELLFVGEGEMAALMREKDWSKTPLGPPETWPQSLRTAVRILLTSRYAMWMGWGPELCFLYNDSYRPTLGAKHPWALGSSAGQIWAEIWSAIGPRIDVVLRRGEATWDEGLLLFLERSGYPEETYHTFSYSPLHDDAGAIGGMLCVVTEETKRVIGERRLALLRELAAQLASSNTIEEVIAAIERCVANDGRDLPFCLAYLFEEGGKRARLISRAAIAADHPGAIPLLDVEDVEAPGSMWPFHEVWTQSSPVMIEELPGESSWPRGPWDSPPTKALAVPIAQQGQLRPAGVFIAGLNPHRPFDDDYLDFVRLFVGQIAAGLANARAYEEERRRAEALAEIDRAKTVFFSNVSHEFRTPLTLMLGPLSDLLDDHSDGGLATAAREQLALVHRNGLRLLKLVNTMLEFSRIEAGRIQAAYEPVDLAEYTADLASVFRAATDKAGLRLVVDCPPVGEPVYVDGDMWEKIVLNLVSNAFKFTLKGEIAVSLRRDGDHVRLTVRDTGSGIPEHELPHLFERFHRVEGTKGRTHEGTGIGLALVQELVKLHGGAVHVESEVGGGSTFTVAIPLGKDHLPGDRVGGSRRPVTMVRGPNAFIEEALRWLPEGSGGEAGELSALPSEGGAAPLPVPGKRERILLADDNADMRDYIRRLLGARWEVEAVGNGLEALRAAERRRPDLVLTDVMMPELDGFGLLQRLRSGEQTREVPVLMLSARAGEEARIEGLQAGAADYLVKPFSARELLARVETLLLRSRLRSLEDAQARRMAEVFAQAPVAIALLRGPSHVYEVANPPYLELVGRRDIAGKPIREALPELKEQGVYELLDEVYASARAFVARSFSAWLIRKEGGEPEECFFDMVFQPIVGKGGEVEGITIVAYEVTELAKARREAEVANRAKDEFLAMLGHELRNPLAPILTALELMRLRGIQGGERERAVIERQVTHVVGLVDDLLDVSRITQGKIQLKKERIELSDALAKAIEMVSPLLEQNRHELRVDVPRHSLAMDADPARLAQVISNLLTNAAKYTKPGGRITVTGQEDGDHVVLRVRDTGIGIDAEMLPRIFDLFTQERQALDRSQGGLGLGLAIVRSLVNLHDGSVSAASEGQGRGTEFTVRLPRAARSSAGDGAGRRRTASGAEARGEARRILIVDDNEDAAMMLVEMLAACGYSARCAHDAPSALQVAEAFDPDVAVLDIGLPVMDGFELARKFGEHPRMRRTRLVAVTGYGQEQDRARSGAAGFLAHLVKPVDLEQLRAVLDGLGRPVEQRDRPE